MYDFKALVKKYSKVLPYILTESAGHYDYSAGGEWVPGVQAWVQFEGAVVPFNREDLPYDENGTYTIEDKKLYTYQDFKKGAKVKHKDIIYTIDKRKDYADFDSSLIIYIAVRGDTA